MEMTSIIPDQPATAADLPQANSKAIAAIEAQIDGLTRIAAFLRANPDLPGKPSLNVYGTLVPLTTDPDPKAAVSAWMLRAIDNGAHVEAFTDQYHVGVRLYFGPTYLQAYARAEQLGEQVEVVHAEQEWRLSIEVPAHARRAEGAQAVNG